jgi:hypothetical protein
MSSKEENEFNEFQNENEYENEENENEDNENEEDNEEENINEEANMNFDEEEEEKPSEETGEKPTLNITFRYFKQTESTKGVEGLTKHNLGKLLGKKRVKFEFSSDSEEPIYYIVTTFEVPKQASEAYSSVKRQNLEIEEGVVQNMVMLFFEEVENEDECEKYKSEITEYPVLKMYVMKKKDQEGRRRFVDCVNNTIQMEKLVNLIHTYYELKMKSVKEIQLEEGNNMLEENVEVKINKNIVSNSVLLKVDDSSKLFLKNPAQKIQLVLSKFRKMMNQFPQHQKELCPVLFEVLKKKDSTFTMEENRAMHVNVDIHKFGKEENLDQFTTKVESEMFVENQSKLEKILQSNKFQKNPLRQYLLVREEEKSHPSQEKLLFDFHIEKNRYYPSFVLEDILLPMIAEKTEKFRLMIPLFTRVKIHMERENEKDSFSEFYLISYLFYDHKKIYFLPLYFVDMKLSSLQMNEMLEKSTIPTKRIMKGVIDSLSTYLRDMIQDSSLQSFAKIYYGGMLSPFIEELENDDLPLNMNHFLIVFFQLFYSILNPDEQPNEILKIFSSNDLNDHFYVFLQFIQEIC